MAMYIQLQNRSLFKVLLLFVVVSLGMICSPPSSSATLKLPPTPDAINNLREGTFLVATDNLQGSSFQETVILITHYNKQGTTGIAINRPTTVTLKEAYPEVKHFKHSRDALYLGGPVRPDTIFVLLKSSRPHKNMQHIGGNVFFSPGISAMIHGMDKNVKGEAARVYAGYTGWAPGQLETEINNGDWLVIKADMDVIFSKEIGSVWKTLHKAWSGTWI